MPNENIEIWKDVQELKEKTIASRFARWEDSVELQMKWQKHVLELRAESIEQWSDLAKADREWGKSYLQKWSIKRMKTDFKVLQRQMQKTKTLEKRLERAASNCAICRNPGARQSTSITRMWSGFAALTAVVPFEVIRKIYDRKPTSAELAGGQYRYYGPKGKSSKSKRRPANALEWCEQLRTMKYIPRNGSDAHMLLMEAFSHLADYPQTVIDEITVKQQLLQQGVYDRWKPQEFLKF